MERLKQNVKGITASIVNGVSAVCSSVVATGLTAGLSSEGLRSLGFYLSLLTSSFYPPKANKNFKRNKNSWLSFASLHIITHDFSPLNAALYGTTNS